MSFNSLDILACHFIQRKYPPKIEIMTKRLDIQKVEYKTKTKPAPKAVVFFFNILVHVIFSTKSNWLGRLHVENSITFFEYPYLNAVDLSEKQMASIS